MTEFFDILRLGSPLDLFWWTGSTVSPLQLFTASLSLLCLLLAPEARCSFPGILSLFLLSLTPLLPLHRHGRTAVSICVVYQSKLIYLVRRKVKSRKEKTTQEEGISQLAYKGVKPLFYTARKRMRKGYPHQLWQASMGKNYTNPRPFAGSIPGWKYSQSKRVTF